MEKHYFETKLYIKALEKAYARASRAQWENDTDKAAELLDKFEQLWYELPEDDNQPCELSHEMYLFAMSQVKAKTVSYAEFREAYAEFENADVRIYNMNTDGTIRMGVNWNSLGTVNPEEALAYAEKISAAAEAAKHFKYNGYTIKY